MRTCAILCSLLYYVVTILTDLELLVKSTDLLCCIKTTLKITVFLLHFSILAKFKLLVNRRLISSTALNVIFLALITVLDFYDFQRVRFIVDQLMPFIAIDM